MYNFFIDLTGVDDYREMYRRIYEGMMIPDYYGANLDALWDMLSDPYGETVHFTLRGTNQVTGTARHKIAGVLKTFQYAEEQLKDFHYEVE
jgi:ribonuclease inhibitor